MVEPSSTDNGSESPEPASLNAIWQVRGSFPQSADATIDAGIGVRRFDDRFAAGRELLVPLGLWGDANLPADRRGDAAEFVLLPNPGASSVTLVFSGNHAQFVLPREVADNADTHVILVRDPRRCFCLAGINGLGPDYATCRDNLERVIGALGAGRRFVIGVSAGGAGALRFACDLAAQGMLGFSVPTTLNIDDDPGAELARYPQLWKLYKHDRSLGIDLGAYYGAMLPRPELTLVYSGNHVRDRWLAERVRLIPGVQLLRPDYAGHATYRWMRDEGKLGNILNILYGSRQVISDRRRHDAMHAR